MSSSVEPNSVVTLNAVTDVGRVRSHNEDNFIVCTDLGEKNWYISDQPVILSKEGCLLVVADGMGGTNAGEVASKIAVDTIREKFNDLELSEKPGSLQAKEFLYHAIMAAHNAIVLAAVQNMEHRGMGTTIIVAWVFGGKAHIGWCGDSRAYLFSKKEGLKILTSDHSLVWEMVEKGELTPEEADVHPRNNIITQCLGDGKRPPRPDFTVCSVEENDRLLLCSDGLNNMVSHKTIEEILRRDKILANAVLKLTETANKNGGDDNITIVGLEVLKGSPQKRKGKVSAGILSGTLAGMMPEWLSGIGRLFYRTYRKVRPGRPFSITQALGNNIITRMNIRLFGS